MLDASRVYLSFGSSCMRAFANSSVLVCGENDYDQMPRLNLEIESLASHEHVFERWLSLSFLENVFSMYFHSLSVGGQKNTILKMF